MHFLETYKVLVGDQPEDDIVDSYYGKWLSTIGFRVGGEYVCIGFSENPGNLLPTIHLINMYGAIKSLMYSEDRFVLVPSPKPKA